MPYTRYVFTCIERREKLSNCLNWGRGGGRYLDWIDSLLLHVGLQLGAVLRHLQVVPSLPKGYIVNMLNKVITESEK